MEVISHLKYSHICEKIQNWNDMFLRYSEITQIHLGLFLRDLGMVYSVPGLIICGA